MMFLIKVFLVWLLFGPAGLVFYLLLRYLQTDSGEQEIAGQ